MPSVNAIEEKKNNVENLDFDELERRLSENLGDELDTELEIQLAEFEFIANKKSIFEKSALDNESKSTVSITKQRNTQDTLVKIHYPPN